MLLKSGEKLHWLKNLYLRYRYSAGCCDTFNYCNFIAPKILKTLKVFKKNLEKGGGCPIDTTWEAWHNELEEMIWAFDYMVNKEEISDKPEEDKINAEREQKGFELFGKRFRDMWI